MLRIHGTKLSQSKFSRMSWLGLAGAVSCCALVLVFGLMLFPSLPQVTYAAIPEVTPSTGTSVGINLPASIDFNSVTPTPDGATTTASADLTVTTTNSAHYSLYLYSSDGDNSLRPNNSANISKINATAGDVGLTLSSLEPNTWGYNLGAEVPTDSTTYSAVPTDNSTPIQTKDTSSTNSANDTYTLSFGAKVDNSIPSGTYSSTLTIAVVAKPAMVTVAFNGNGATSGSMSSIKIPAGGSQTLPSNVFTRNGYVFNGWNTASNGSGTSYADGANYTASTSYAGQTVTLYAQWKEEHVVINDVYPTTGWAGNTIQITLNRIPSAGIDSITIGGTACAALNVSGNTVSCTLPSKAASSDNGYAVEVISANSAQVADNHNFTVRYFNPSRTITVGSTNTSHRTMQTFTSANCSSMRVGQTVSLTDTRNGQTYRVRKMADNKCWMIDNMKYLGEEMTINNEDGTSGIFLNDTDGNWNTSDGEIISDAKAIYNNPMTQSYCYDEALSSSYTKCGYLYNFYAVAAGTTSSRREPPEITICPVGWRLPTSGEDNTSDYAVLNASMANGNYTYPGSYAQSSDSKYYAGFQFDGAWSGVLSGRWTDRFGFVGVQGGYWASGQPLVFRRAQVMPSYTGNPSSDYGFAVRCVMP